MATELMCERLRHMGLATCNEAAQVIEQQADRIAALEAKCALYAASLDRSDRDIAALKSDIEAQIQLTREAMELAGRYQRDAERYRWLTKQIFATKERHGPQFCLPLPAPVTDPMRGSVEQHFDAAIDAHLGQKEPT